MFQIGEWHQKHSYSVRVFLIMMLVFLLACVPTVTISQRNAEAILAMLHFLRLPIERNPCYYLQATKSSALNILPNLRMGVLLFVLTDW